MDPRGEPVAVVLRTTRRIFVDTEFTDLPWTGRSGLFWVGLADEQLRTWSALVADIDLSRTSEFVLQEVLPRIPRDEPRLNRPELRAAIVDFCGDVEQFWAWCPSRADLVALGLSDRQSAGALGQYRDWDFHLLRRVVDPWPPGWPAECLDLHAAATAAAIDLPPNPEAHHPAADALWNAAVFAKLREP